MEKLFGITGQGQPVSRLPFYLKTVKWPVSSQKDSTCPKWSICLFALSFHLGWQQGTVPDPGLMYLLLSTMFCITGYILGIYMEVAKGLLQHITLATAKNEVATYLEHYP